jgi:hypothetical protein
VLAGFWIPPQFVIALRLSLKLESVVPQYPSQTSVEVCHGLSSVAPNMVMRVRNDFDRNIRIPLAIFIQKVRYYESEAGPQGLERVSLCNKTLKIRAVGNPNLRFIVPFRSYDNQSHYPAP